MSMIADQRLARGQRRLDGIVERSSVMTVPGRSIILALAVSLLVMRPCLAQSTAAPVTQPPLTQEEMDRFLRQAEIVATKSTKTGVTNAKRVTLSDGQFRHDAQVQDVNIELPIFN